MVSQPGVRFPKATMVASSVVTNRVQWKQRPLANDGFDKHTPEQLRNGQNPSISIATYICKPDKTSYNQDWRPEDSLKPVLAVPAPLSVFSYEKIKPKNNH